MFNKDFYPTPYEVVLKMLENENIAGARVLEPSAGKGNILNVLKEFGAFEVLTCEIIEEFQPYLAENSRFLKPDFLDVTANEISHVDYIIMNPPFSKAIEHIQHAYEIAPPGCTIIALCNENDTKQDHGGFYRESEEFLRERIEQNKRKAKFNNYIENHGFIEKFGNCFENSERHTNVYVSKVVLFKDGNEDGLNFDVYMDYSFDDDSRHSGVMTYNEVREAVNRVVAAVNKYQGMIEKVKEMNQLVEAFDEYGYNKLSVSFKNDRSHVSLTDYKKQLQKCAWQWIFSKLNLEKFQTTKLKEQMNKLIEIKVNYPFTVKNVYAVLDMIFQTHAERMQSTLVEAFDIICSYSKENSSKYEGWETNSAYKVNQQFIVPYICQGYESYFTPPKSYPFVKLNGYRDNSKVEDIYKALCHMTGIDYNSITHFYSYVENRRMSWGKWYECGFFEIRGYKKGTMHFKFVDKKIWEMFNRRVAELKGWPLPQKTDHKTTGRERKKTTGVEVYEMTLFV